jgi:phosphohistidine phosphatase
MELFLVRHAIAANRDPDRWPDDSQRPLTKEGEASFRKAARGLARVVPTVDAVLASPFPRAWRTAEILAEDGGWPAPEACEALEAGRPIGPVIEVIRERADVASVALVGHEPDLGELASRLLTGREDVVAIEMKKGGVACLGVDDLDGAAVLRWLAPPRILRALSS